MKHFNPLSDQTRGKIGIATLAILALCIAASLIAFFAGTVFFENPLPKRFLDYDGWLNLLFGACGIYLGWLGLKQGLKQFFEEDVVEVTYDKDGKVVEEYRIDEIAKIIRRTPSAVKMRLQKGRKLLEKIYREEYL